MIDIIDEVTKDPKWGGFEKALNAMKRIGGSFRFRAGDYVLTASFDVKGDTLEYDWELKKDA
jgi:hypothetical protein